MNNTYDKTALALDPHLESRAITLEAASDFYDQANSARGGCNGYGACGHGVNYAAMMAITEYAANNGITMPTDLAKVDNMQNALKRALYADGHNDVTIGNSTDKKINFGDEPVQNLDRYRIVKDAADAYMRNCGAACFE